MFHYFCGVYLLQLYLCLCGNLIIIASSSDIQTDITNNTCFMGDEQNGSGVCDVSNLSAIVDGMQWKTATVDNSIVSLAGTSNISQSGDGVFHIKSNLSITKATESKCPSLMNADNLSQIQLINRLTAPCRYDRLEKPNSYNQTKNNTIDIYIRSHIFVMQNLDTSNLQFTIQGILQLRYVDPRLAFGNYVKSHRQTIIGESELRNLIWVPHLFITNEQDSTILGTSEKDILTSISENGTIIITTRLKATLYCWMDLQKFPFDDQECSTIFESWMYNSSELLLHWENATPISFDVKMQLTEYSLTNYWVNESIITTNLSDVRPSILYGNYSSLSFTVALSRESGYYIMEYFIPSMMIVAISWVSFWLQADNTPARTTLGTTTLLSLITLSSSQDKSLPKVSYIKVSEIWFLVCTCFIFGSLIEFAFVNTIWRRKRDVQMKKITGKNILKKTMTPTISSHKIQHDNRELNTSAGNFLNVDSPVVLTATSDCLNYFRIDSSTSSLSVEDNTENNSIENQNDARSPSWSSMTPHEVSLWIDRKARFIFPLLFIIFNAFFWTFIYCL